MGTLIDNGCTDIRNDDFESDWNGWIDGGSDARRTTGDAAFASSGSYCVRLRDNTETSVITTGAIDLSGYTAITVDFTYITTSMESGEDFWLQVSTDGGSTFTTVGTWVSGTDFNEAVREFDNITINGPFTSDTRLRFRCDASDDTDRVYIDDVRVQDCTGVGSLLSGPATQIATNVGQNGSGKASAEHENAELFPRELLIFPNPATNEVYLEHAAFTAAEVQVVVFNGLGQRVFQDKREVEGRKMQLNVGNFDNGLYYVKCFIAGKEELTGRFIVSKR